MASILSSKLCFNLTNAIKIRSKHGNVCRPRNAYKVKRRDLMKDLVPKALDSEMESRRKIREARLTMDIPTDISLINGMPDEHAERMVKIFKPSKNAMQSGTYNVRHWKIEFNAGGRWENPNMGWCSSGDPLSNLTLNFSTKEDAIAFCNKNGWGWYVLRSSTDKKFRPKSYSDNFIANKKCRVSTK